MNATPSSVRVVRALLGDATSDAYLAEVNGSAEPKMLRVLKPELAQDAAHVDGLIAAAQALMPVRHPSLVGIQAAGRMKDGRVYVLSDFEDGESLQSRGMVPVGSLVELAMPVCDALGAVHQTGLAVGLSSARDVVLTEQGPKLDVAAGLLRRTDRSFDSDVRTLTQVLTSMAAPGADKPRFESELQKVNRSPSVKALRSSLEGLRSEWSGKTSVNGGQRDAQVEEVEPDLSGSLLGQYKLESILGEGAMGRVYFGRHARIGREAAIKVLKREHARNQDLVKRFIQEATAVNAIKNEHIVEVYDFGEESDPQGGSRVYCVMEKLEGTALVDEMMKTPLSLKRAVDVCLQLTRALGAAHALGIVHRDVKPENVFLRQKAGERDFVKVLDFGVAKLLKPIGELPVSGTLAGVVIGTPEYMAPEQALGQNTDFRVDLYAVGLVLYELLSGRQPFQGDTFGKLVVEITNKQPAPLPAKTQTGEPIPRALEAVVMRALAKKAEHRWASADAMAQALEPFLEADLAQLVEAEQKLDDEIVTAITPPKKWAKWVAVAGVLALLGAGGWFALGGSDAPKMAATVAPTLPPDPTAAKPDPAPAPIPAAASKVKLEVVSEPAGAKVIRQDTHAVLGQTPLSVELGRGEGKLKLAIELEGHQTVEREVDLDENSSLSLDLPPKPAAAKKPGPAPKKAVSRDGVLDPFAN